MFLRLRMAPLVAPSVNIDLCCSFFTPVVALRQPRVRIGFPSGKSGDQRRTLEFQRFARIATSTESGFAPKAVKHFDTRFFRQLTTYVTRFCDLAAEKADTFFIFARCLSPRPVASCPGRFLSNLGYEVTSL